MTHFTVTVRNMQQFSAAPRVMHATGKFSMLILMARLTWSLVIVYGFCQRRLVSQEGSHPDVISMGWLEGTDYYPLLEIAITETPEMPDQDLLTTPTMVL